MAKKTVKRQVKKEEQIKKGKTASVKTLAGPEIKAAIKDILGHLPKKVTIEFEKEKKLKVASGRVHAGEGEWSGNIYKYRY